MAGIPPRWTSSAKSGVGTALSGESRVCFTLSHGILNEVYFPRVDKACIRDLGFIVTDGSSFFSGERRHTRSEVSRLPPGSTVEFTFFSPDTGQSQGTNLSVQVT
jgi:glucoamylase